MPSLWQATAGSPTNDRAGGRDLHDDGDVRGGDGERAVHPRAFGGDGIVLPGRPGGSVRAPNRVAPAATLTAGDLRMEYERDPAGADWQFRDRPVVVSGTVSSVGRDLFDGRLVVRLNTGASFETVNAKLSKSEDAALSMITKGRPLSLGCVGRGALIGVPLLGNCLLL